MRELLSRIRVVVFRLLNISSMIETFCVYRKKRYNDIKFNVGHIENATFESEKIHLKDSIDFYLKIYDINSKITNDYVSRRWVQHRFFLAVLGTLFVIIVRENKAYHENIALSFLGVIICYFWFKISVYQRYVEKRTFNMLFAIEEKLPLCIFKKGEEITYAHGYKCIPEIEIEMVLALGIVYVLMLVYNFIKWV